MLIQFVLFATGVAVLALGADVFVRGASGLALRLGVRPFVVGLVVVGFGTSSPELAVNLSAALRGTTDLALGNVVGSNIANIGLILGTAALAAPMLVHMRMLRTEIPIMILSFVALWLFALGGAIRPWQGVVLFAGFAGFLAFLLHGARAESAEIRRELAEAPHPPSNGWLTAAFIVGGLAMLVAGSSVAVDAAIAMARLLGMSDLVIGLTIVAVGTSLPELASTVAAALKGESDLAIGNVIGSNIYNVLFILGATAIVAPIPVAPSMVRLEIPAMVAFAVMLLPMLARRMRISRRTGALLLAAYVALLLASSGAFD